MGEGEDWAFGGAGFSLEREGEKGKDGGMGEQKNGDAR